VSLSFVVEQAGCDSCAALVREALEPLAAVESIDIDENADVALVRLGTAATEEDVDRALAAVAEGAGHAYRIQPGSWRAA
jgi:copper chaperone CopZ